MLLDWKLWGDAVATAKRHKIAEIVKFLRVARAKLVPVFIFTNDDLIDVAAELPEDVYRTTSRGEAWYSSRTSSECGPASWWMCGY